VDGLNDVFVHLAELLLFRPKLFQISHYTVLFSRVCPIMAHRDFCMPDNPAT